MDPNKSDASPAAKPPPVTISRVHINGLFGLYTYDLPGSDLSFDRLTILYGENGLGKTNILRTLFHLLSPAGDRGHRTALAKTKFRRAEVTLSNHVLVSATRTGDLIAGSMRLEVAKQVGNKRELLGAWDWFPKGDPARDVAQRWLLHADPAAVRIINTKGSQEKKQRAIQTVLYDYLERGSNPLESEEAFLRALRENVPPVYFLTADRVLSADQVARDSTPMPQIEPGGLRPEALLTMGRERALNDAILLASRMFSRLSVRAARAGSTSMHSIYQGLIRRLASRATGRASRAPQTIADLTQRLNKLSTTYDLFSAYGLAPKIQAGPLIEGLANVRPTERSVAAEVLRPYVESLTEQAKNLSSAYTVIDTFIGTVNDFLYDKRAEFSVGEGISVKNRLGDSLEPKDLSSGEQQLFLLFCQITLAHDSGGIFIVDEPEISLNVKWQRRLLDSLMRLDPSANLQFILASHSMEILAKHRECVVPLREAVDG